MLRTEMRTRVERLLPLLHALILVQLCLLPKGCLSSNSCNDDKITKLPGQPSVKFQQFAGYIPVDDQKQRTLFYYFVEAETKPNLKPLVLFLAGGPGCSGVGLEAFAGNGAFKPSGNGGLVRDKYNWNKEANMLYVDSPAGVGFSYSLNKSFYYHSVNDETTARDNLQFLKGWLTRYPQYKKRDLFITGVSYAGHFVPQLANLVLKTNLKRNLKGISIASPLLEAEMDFNSKAVYLWSHGLISDSTYESLNNVCNFSQIMRQSYSGELSPACAQVNSAVSSEVGNHINPSELLAAGLCSSNATSHSQETHVSSSPDECVYQKAAVYLNRKDVQMALNAKLVGVEQWTICSDVRFEGNSVVHYDLRDGEVSSLPLLAKLVKSGVRVMIYSGDQDSAIPFIATRTHIGRLANQLGLKTTVPYQSWLQANQVGGWTQAYGQMLAYATVRGAGHEPWHSQPERSLAIFNIFLRGKTLPLSNSG